MSPAELERSLAIELPARQAFEKSIDKLARDHPFATQGGEPLHDIAQRHNRTDRQRPEHGIGVQHKP